MTDAPAPGDRYIPHTIYLEEADCLESIERDVTVFHEERSGYSVLREMKTGNIVGVRIYGARAILLSALSELEEGK